MAVIYQEKLSIEDKLRILSDAAKYDVACTSSGVERAGKKGEVGNSAACGICHSFAADGRCISLLKILYTNECIYDCKYCINRSTNDTVRTSFTPEEVCTLTMEFYRRNYIEGLFLSSSIRHSPNETMEQIVKALKMLREEYHFNGYIHCKAIPGASDDLIEMAGWYADRMSVNLELPTAEGLRRLAPHKSRQNILLPMRKIQNGIAQSQALLGMSGGNRGAYWHTTRRLEHKSVLQKQREDDWRVLRADNETAQMQRAGQIDAQESASADAKQSLAPALNEMPPSHSGEKLESTVLRNTNAANALTFRPSYAGGRGFAAAGQSTQMILGASSETDYQMLTVAEALYRQFDLKRVFYSAFIRVNDDSSLPVLPGGPPLQREHRMYQADWLLRYYGFQARELLSESRPNFNTLLDPKCNWAVGHLEQFPMEVNRAEYFELLRVPGIGPKSARRIVEARKTAVLDFKDLKKLGVVLKRALYFITCSGRLMYPTKLEERYIIDHLLEQEKMPADARGDSFTYQQLSLFDCGIAQ